MIVLLVLKERDVSIQDGQMITPRLRPIDSDSFAS